MFEKKYSKTIKIFLIDGDPNGRMSCELSNWTGKAYKIPRINVKDCKDRPDIQNTGIYLLFGKNDEGVDQVYIGEAESILNRLNQHLSGKEFWNETILFISKDNNLNKAHIKYIESRLYKLAHNAKRYRVENSVIPTQSSISEMDSAEMEEFISNIKMLTNALGHKVFEDKREVSAELKKDTFIIKGSRGADAQGEPTSEGFVVFKGSKASAVPVPSMNPSLLKLRQSLIDKNFLKQGDDSLEFNEDYIFSSPSTASSIVLGRSSNGLVDWKHEDGRTLKDFESVDAKNE
ncbi:MAG: GIY-YIG nuclease family protein [Chloroflexota bacterium]